MALYQALADYCTDRKSFSESEDRNQLQNDWARYLKIYRNYLSGSYPSKGKIHIPMTFGNTMRLHSAIMSNIRRNRDIVRFISEPKHDLAVPNAINANDAMQQAAAFYIAKGRLLREIAKWELESCTLGTSFLKTTWEYNDNYDGLMFEHRPIYTIFVDPKAYNKAVTVDELEYIIDQRYISIDKLFSNDKFFNRKEVVERKNKGNKAETRENTSVEQAIDQILNIGNTGVETRDDQSDQILVEEYWGRVPRGLLKGRNKQGYTGDDLSDFIDAYIVIANGVIVWAQENPYPKGRKPYDLIRCYPVPNMFYGIGVPELLEPLQRATNAVTNQRIDNVNLVLNKMWAFRQNMVNPKHLVSRPGGFIPVRGNIQESLMPLDTRDVTNSAYRETDVYDGYGQKYSGIADIFFGYTTKQTRVSATEATLATEMGAGIMEEIVAGQVQDGFVPLMEKVRDYIQAFNSEPLPVMVDGQPVTVTPEMLRGDFELIPTIGEQMFTKTAELQKTMMLLQLMQTLGPRLESVEGKQVSFSKLAERAFSYAGWKDYGTIVTSAEGTQEPQAVGGGSELLGLGGGTEEAPAGGGGGFEDLLGETEFPQ